MVQFEIRKIVSLDLFGYDVSFTNSSLMMIVSLVLICAFMIFAMSSRSLVPSRVQSMAEIVYEYVAGMVTENLGQDGMKFFPWVFSIFHLHSGAQPHRLIPGNFTVTSHIIVTFALAAMVWIVATLIGFWKHGFGLSEAICAFRAYRYG